VAKNKFSKQWYPGSEWYMYKCEHFFVHPKRCRKQQYIQIAKRRMLGWGLRWSKEEGLYLQGVHGHYKPGLTVEIWENSIKALKNLDKMVKVS